MASVLFSCFFLVVSTSTLDCLEMTYYVWNGTLNFTQSLTHRSSSSVTFSVSQQHEFDRPKSFLIL